MQDTMRPGVWVDYTTLPARVLSSGKTVGVLGAVPGITGGEEPALERFSSLSEALARFGGEGELPALLRAVFDNALCEVYAAGTDGSDEGRMRALDILFRREEPYCIVCGGSADVLRYGRRLAAESEKLLFAPCPGGDDPAAFAEELNCVRVLLTSPPVYGSADMDVSHALLAALTARQDSPLSNLFGEEVVGDYSVPGPLSEEELNLRLRRGITVFEQGSLCPEVVRAVTTRTRDSSGAPDSSMRNLSVPLTLDRVVGSLRSALRRRLDTGAASLSDVSAALEWELWLQREAGFITGYEKPAAHADPEDASRCLASAAFRLKQGLAQIDVHAQITL